MAWVSVSAIVVSALRLAEEPDKPQGPLFLSLVAIQSAAATWPRTEMVASPASG